MLPCRGDRWCSPTCASSTPHPPVDRPLLEEAQELLGRGAADALLLTGSQTGRPADLAELAQLRAELPGAALLLASGVTPDGIRASAAHASGWIVGSFAQGGIAGRSPVASRIEQLTHARREALGL